jgi:chemotaxis methyl-accepting protein methylase/chemotaxis receptor (MCP) glutamine deamidase CheD
MKSLKETLKGLTGIDFDYYQEEFFKKRTKYRMNNLNIPKLEDYISYLQANPKELDQFLEKFTINYTYFFRNIEVFNKLEKSLDFSKLNPNRPLRIWSCPCATGEEPYTIAMLFDYYSQKYPNFPDYKITASDIDGKAIVKAKMGFYNEYAIHETPQYYLSTYFTRKNSPIGPEYVLSNRIKEKVEFIEEDLIKGHIKNKKYDIILCRNLLIYIKRNARENLLRTLESRLINGGLLILGMTESLFDIETNFRSIDTKYRFYVKNSIKNSFLLRDGITESKIPKTQVIKKKEVLLPKNKPSIAKRTRTLQSKLGSDVREIQINKIGQNPKDSLGEIRLKNKIQVIKKELAIKDVPISIDPKQYASEIKRLSNQERKTLLDQQLEVLKNRELQLEQKSRIIEQRAFFLEERNKKLNKEIKKSRVLLQRTREREVELKELQKNLDYQRIQIQKREQQILNREEQLKRRLEQLGQQSSSMIRQEIKFELNSNQNVSRTIDIELEETFEKGRVDRIMNPNSNNELALPKGYFGLINSFDVDEAATKISINGLGAGIALILKDSIQDIFAMSHIYLPDSSASKQDYHLLFPHTFADTSVKDLYNNLLYHGAKKGNISAVIIGGAKLFLDYDLTFQENIDHVKKALESLNIKIKLEEIGGISERSIIYDTINDSVYIKKTWELEYRKL